MHKISLFNQHEPLPPPNSTLVGESNHTEIFHLKILCFFSIKSTTAFTCDKQLCAAFMAVTVVTVLF